MSFACLRFLSLSLVASAALIAGCGDAADVTPGAAKPAATGAPIAASPAGKVHDHSGWWCTEHGVPEDQCGQCSAKLAAQFKRDGDWCREHDRPDSQCFICHPEYEGKFITLYEAKFGEQPPARPEESAE